MNYNGIVTQFKLKLESAVTTGSNDIRMSRDEYVKVCVALTNLLLEDAELRELNRDLVVQLSENNNTDTVLDGGGF